MLIKFGDIVPLHLQLYDGNESMTVVATVISPLQDTIFEGEMLHVKNGLYKSNQFRMPSVDYVVAMYTVFKGTRESQDYERATEIFQLDTITPAVAESTNEIIAAIDDANKEVPMLVGNQISEVLMDGSFLEGVEIP